VSKPSAVFLDRDGTINQKAPEGDYVKTLRELRLLPRAALAIRRLNDARVPVVVVTNQRGIALGRMTESDLRAIHRELEKRLRRTAGAHIDAFLYCPHDEGECDCRKPSIGMFLRAKDLFSDLHLDRAVMIGDSPADVTAGRRAGMATIQIGHDVPDLETAVDRVLAP
jgi:D-glycero-D-manno-heptose 1,7-bisphosphate phosphatase